MTKDLHFLSLTIYIFVFKKQKYTSLIFKLQLFGSFHHSHLVIMLTRTRGRSQTMQGFAGHIKDFVLKRVVNSNRRGREATPSC